MSLRSFGKAAFAHLQDWTGRLQVYVKTNVLGEEAFGLFRNLDLGDCIGVSGALFRTKTGELTLEAQGLKLLSKCLRPLPEKWHGLTDIEARYRQRYLDLLVNTDAREVLRKRVLIIRTVRKFFDERDFLEVETPMMHPIAGGALARPFVAHHNALDMDLYLRIAPELYLKRLMVGGVERVYELNRNFRNEGISPQHNPEFTMLEFYQAYATYEELMSLTEKLFETLSMTLFGSLKFPYGDWTIDLTPPWARVGLKEAICGIMKCSMDTLNDEPELRDLGRSLGVNESLSPGKLLVEIFERAVEPLLVQPTFITGFPLAVSPLARRNERDPGIVDRFELYIAGREIANAFSELNDPEDQRERFQEQMRAREAGDEEAAAMDEDYVRALEYGLPPAAGEGVGIDRVVMLFTGALSIRDTILFPQLRAEKP
jgi:lysyl-tRNA synthetase class 2